MRPDQIDNVQQQKLYDEVLNVVLKTCDTPLDDRPTVIEIVGVLHCVATYVAMSGGDV